MWIPFCHFCLTNSLPFALLSPSTTPNQVPCHLTSYSSPFFTLFLFSLPSIPSQQCLFAPLQLPSSFFSPFYLSLSVLHCESLSFHTFQIMAFTFRYLWLVKMVTYPVNTIETFLLRLSLNGGKLSFRWFSIFSFIMHAKHLYKIFFGIVFHFEEILKASFIHTANGFSG